ncbi:MAG TPA: DUF1549 domain-containing protein [Pirellulales bacterium]|nr:DUF1549 domain-containing protein [Pirellulales bacterium]
MPMFADESEAAFLPPGSGQLDSEALLVKRREFRLGQLPPPPGPPDVELPDGDPNVERHAIDRFLQADWQAAGLEAVEKPPALCDDATFVRRAFLDLVGVIPTVLECNHFLADRSPQRRAKLVDQLLARHADYAAHGTPFWEDALASQPVLSQGGIPTRGNYRDWIHQSLEQNRPYDVMVAELLDPTMPRRKAADTEDVLGIQYTIEYVRNEDHTATLQTAANVGQVFLGTSMKCAGCHDHFENAEWPQERFLGFAGLFAPSNLERIRCEVKTGQVVPAQFPFELAGAPRDVPGDLDGRLHLTAQLVTDPANPRFAKTIVNRLWKRYLGLGLFEPADDFRLDVPASHPALLDWLAHDFLAHGCDLKHTIRLILTSHAYQRRYEAALEDHFAAGETNPPRHFRSPTLRRLTAEQLLDSLRVATSGGIDAQERCYLDYRSTALMRALGRPASRNEISTARGDDAAVVQALELLNGAEIDDLLGQSAILAAPAARQDPRRVVDPLYLAVLSRHATPAEKKLGKEFLASAASLDEGLRDMLWALVCCPEFQYIR